MILSVKCSQTVISGDKIYQVIRKIFGQFFNKLTFFIVWQKKLLWIINYYGIKEFFICLTTQTDHPV